MRGGTVQETPLSVRRPESCATAGSEEDLPALLGEEEVAILLPRTTAKHAMLVAERVRTGLLTLADEALY